MKNAMILCATLLLAINTNAQRCCSSDESWGQMVASAKFQSDHEAPLPLNYKNENAGMISFNTQDGKEGQAYYVPSDKGTQQVLLIFHEWWGLNDYIKREAVRWQEKLGNIDVYAVDLYDGKVAATPQEASVLSKGLDPKRARTIIQGLLSEVGRDKRIATLGWCMGGSWSFTAAVMAGDQTAACVMYYGFPEQEDKLIKPLKADVLYIYASQDDHIPYTAVTEFQKDVEATGNKFILHTYNAVHAFANPSNPKYNEAAATEAAAITERFIEEKLQLE